MFVVQGALLAVEHESNCKLASSLHVEQRPGTADTRWQVRHPIDSKAHAARTWQVRWLWRQLPTAFSSSVGVSSCTKRADSAEMDGSWPSHTCNKETEHRMTSQTASS